MTLDELTAMLAPEETPASYAEAWHAILASHAGNDHDGDGDSLDADADARVSPDEVTAILASTGLPPPQQQAIRQLAFSAQSDGGQGLREVEFSVLLALIGLAQHGRAPTFETINEMRNALPTPKIGYIDGLRRRTSPLADDNHDN
ncbi:Sorting nexin mvp1, partial [Ascosphaera acerosa]